MGAFNLLSAFVETCERNIMKFIVKDGEKR